MLKINIVRIQLKMLLHKLFCYKFQTIGDIFISNELISYTHYKYIKNKIFVSAFYFKICHIFKPLKPSVIEYFTNKLLSATWSIIWAEPFFSAPAKEDFNCSISNDLGLPSQLHRQKIEDSMLTSVKLPPND